MTIPRRIMFAADYLFDELPRAARVASGIDPPQLSRWRQLQNRQAARSYEFPTRACAQWPKRLHARRILPTRNARTVAKTQRRASPRGNRSASHHRRIWYCPDRAQGIASPLILRSRSACRVLRQLSRPSSLSERDDIACLVSSRIFANRAARTMLPRRASRGTA